MFNVLGRNALAPLILRLGLATIFIFHGLGKVKPETEWGSKWAPPGLELPAPAQAAAAWGELLGGAALALGFLTRIAAAVIIGIMAVAIYKVHGGHGFALPAGFEYNFAIIAMCLALIFSGGGILAVDWLFWGGRRRT